MGSFVSSWFSGLPFRSPVLVRAPSRGRRFLHRQSEGSPPSGAIIAPRSCIRLDPPVIRTRKQPSASAARLRDGGPILATASKPWASAGHRHLGPSTAAFRNLRVGAETVFSLLVGPAAQAADRSTMPSGTVPVITMRHSAISTLRASAVILARERRNHGGLARALGGLGARPVPLHECAVFLEPEEPPGELDQATAHTSVSRLRQPPLPALGAALVGRSREPGIARYRSSIPQVA